MGGGGGGTGRTGGSGQLKVGGGWWWWGGTGGTEGSGQLKVGGGGGTGGTGRSGVTEGGWWEGGRLVAETLTPGSGRGSEGGGELVKRGFKRVVGRGVGKDRWQGYLPLDRGKGSCGTGF